MPPTLDVGGTTCHVCRGIYRIGKGGVSLDDDADRCRFVIYPLRGCVPEAGDFIANPSPGLALDELYRSLKRVRRFALTRVATHPVNLDESLIEERTATLSLDLLGPDSLQLLLVRNTLLVGVTISVFRVELL